MKALSLDLANDCGYALSVDGVIKSSGTIHLARQDDVYEGRRGERLLRFLQEEIGPCDFYITEKAMQSFKSNPVRPAMSYGGYRMILLLVQSAQRVPLLEINSTTLKKEFTGTGRADKKLMCAQAHALGWKAGAADTDKDHNEADAIALQFVGLPQAISYCANLTEPLQARFP